MPILGIVFVGDIVRPYLLICSSIVVIIKNAVMIYVVLNITTCQASNMAIFVLSF